MKLVAALHGRASRLSRKASRDAQYPHCLEEAVHFDVWHCIPRVTLTFEIHDRCPHLAWVIVSVFFGSSDFLGALRAECRRGFWRCREAMASNPQKDRKRNHLCDP